jgi:hypothetical protein
MPEMADWSEAVNWTPEHIQAWVSSREWQEGLHVDFKSKRLFTEQGGTAG